MEFIYSAFNNSQAVPIKGKISRWRHLETILTQFILIGLVFFLILQNGSLRRQISSKLSHQIVEDILSQKMIQLTKQIEETKSLILQGRKKELVHAQQLKKIIKILIREIGLPLPKATHEAQKPTFLVEGSKPINQRTYNQQQKPTVYEQDKFDDQRYEEDSEEEYQSEEDDHQGNDVQLQELTSPKELDTCTYMQYLLNALGDQHTHIIQNYQDDSAHSQEIMQTFGKGKASKGNNYLTYYIVDQLKSILMIGGHLLLVFLAFLCLFILGSFMKNPKYQCKPGETFENILKGTRKTEEEPIHHTKQRKIL